MPQDRESGAAGNDFGRETAPLIAQKIGAVLLGPSSNEATLNGERVVIKCAGPRTNSVGVSYQMLERLHRVIGAFQQDDGSFKVISLAAPLYRQELRDTRSRGASAGKVGIVSKSIFESSGQSLGTIQL